MKTKKKVLTDQELALMNIVWSLEEATVRDVYEELRRSRRIAYTTVMTMMGILEAKGHLKKRSQGRAYVYAPTRPRNQVVRDLVKDFLNRVFDGSAEPLLQHLIRNGHFSKEELEQIRKALEEQS